MLFLGTAALGVVSAVLIAIVVPESPVRTAGRFDLLGALGLAAGLISLLLAVSKGGDWHWGSATTLGLFAAAPVILLAWACSNCAPANPL